MKEYIERKANRRIIKMVDYEAMRAAFDAKFKETMKLIESGETHLDNLAEGFHEADGVIFRMPAADVVERKRGRCKFCGGKDNAFHIINAETVAYSGIEIAINRWGMLRVRVYDDYECETALPRSSEIVMIAACPNCGADMKEG